MVSGPKTLTAVKYSKSRKVEPPYYDWLTAHSIPFQMFNQNPIRGISRPNQHLELFVTFLKSFPSRVTECIILLKMAIALKGWTWSATMFGQVVCVKVNPLESQDPMFPCRSLPRASQSLCQLAILQQYILVPPLSKLSDTHVASQLHPLILGQF